MPNPPAEAAETASEVSKRLARSQWFSGGTSTASTTSESALDLRLQGLITGPQGAFAIIQQDGAGKPLVLTLGSSHESGVKFIQAGPRSATLNYQGRDIRLVLPTPNERDTPPAEKD